MTRDVYSVDLSPRENRHVEPSLLRDVKDVVMGAWLLFILFCIAVVAMAGCA